MAQSYSYRPEVRRRQFRTLSMICEEDGLSEAQIKAYQTQLVEYRAFLDSVSRLAMSGNVCVTEEAVSIGDSGLLTGESLNALQHAGAISVYNTLQQNNWDFPIPEDSEVAVVKAHAPVLADEFLDSEKPIRPDWPSVHVTDCFIDGERARLHGLVRPLRTYLPPTIILRNPTDLDLEDDDDEEEVGDNGPDQQNSNTHRADQQHQNKSGVELVMSSDGIAVRHTSADDSQECTPIDEYYFGRQDGSYEYTEEKGDFRFKCAVCLRMFHSNVKLMSHIMTHVDENRPFEFISTDPNNCNICDASFSNPTEVQAHIQQEHADEDQSDAAVGAAQTASQLLRQRSTSGGADSTTVDLDRKASANCRICGHDASSELDLAQHLQARHRQCEMPYVCRLCLFRSSLYEDLLDHFKLSHANSNHLLCTYCLRIFTPPDAHRGSGLISPNSSGGSVCQTQVYLQHLRMHQTQQQLRSCATCKLNFVNKSDYQVHRRLDHKATRAASTTEPTNKRPVAEVVQPATVKKTPTTTTVITKVKSSSQPSEPTITYVDIDAAALGVGGNQFSILSSSQAVDVTNTTASNYKHDPQVKLLNAPQAGGVKSLAGLKLPTNIDQFACLECGRAFGTNGEHDQYVPCSICRFATCCQMGYNQHHKSAHILVDASRSQALDSGTPCVKPVFFDWMRVEQGQGDSSAQVDASTAESYFTNCTTDAKAFYCTHCWLGGLTGNELARHMVEECGAYVATLNPDSALVEQARLNQLLTIEQDVSGSGEASLVPDSHQPTDLLYQAYSAATAGSMAVDQQHQLMAVDQQAISQDQQQANLMPQTFDVTDADGQVVQQIIVPDDIQLEEGQSLVLIQDEDGQPQLAIVNQADLLEGDGSQLVLQTDEDQSIMTQVYDAPMVVDEQAQYAPVEAANGSTATAATLVQADDEKENQMEQDQLYQ